MKIISIEEFSTSPQAFLYALVSDPQKANGVWSDQLTDLALKSGTFPGFENAPRTWTGTYLFNTTMMNLSGRDPEEIDGLFDFMQGKGEEKSIPYSPSAGSERLWETDDAKHVLVFEDEDIEELIGILYDSFPDTFKRFLAEKLNVTST